MLTTAQRWIIFVIFCLIVLTCVTVEACLVYSVVEKGFTNTKLVSAFLAGGLLVGCRRPFMLMISRNFLKSNVLSSARLQKLSSERCTIIENARRSNEEVYLTRGNLIRNTLKFCEESLKGWVPGSHFELCVFVDQDQPLLFAYYDSNHDTNARSMKERERNPRFYVEKGYEVIRLLQTPTSQALVLKNTLDEKANYVFTSSQQRKQIKSSVLICLDLNTPCALVVSSNKTNAFSESESEVMLFIRYIGELVRYDLIEEDFIRQIRGFKPSLFEVAARG